MQINKSKKDQISIAELNIYVRKKKEEEKSLFVLRLCIITIEKHQVII